MLSTRADAILRSIVRQYIEKATLVASQSVAEDTELDVSPATIRNEMVHLEENGYIVRPHHAAGSMPSDKGYRYYVETLADIELPAVEQRLIDHLFHQIEMELNEWLNLASTLAAQMVRNVALVTAPKPLSGQFKHVELVALQDSLALVILVLRGARVRQQLFSFDEPVSQIELRAISDKLNDAFTGLNCTQIAAKKGEFSLREQAVTDCLIKLMTAEDRTESEGHYLDGLHFMLNQPEFNRNCSLMGLVELAEQRALIRSIIPERMSRQGVQVIIGRENRNQAVRDYSVVFSHYGVPEQAIGTISVVGPTRMPYALAIPTVGYLSRLLSRLVAELYEKETEEEDTDDRTW